MAAGPVPAVEVKGEPSIGDRAPVLESMAERGNVADCRLDTGED